MGKEQGPLSKAILSNQNSDLLKQLVNLPGSNLNSLLMSVFETNIGDTNLLRRYKDNNLLSPSTINQKDLLKFENLIFNQVPYNFDSIELSPVNPLGLNSRLTNLSQNNILSGIRNAEVLSDVTTALTLECALRRKIAPDIQIVNLCSNHRSLRLQQYNNKPGFSSHFKVFGMCSGGKDFGHESFKMLSLDDHIRTYLKILSEANINGFEQRSNLVKISDIRITEKIIQKMNINRIELGKQTRNNDFSFFDFLGEKSKSQIESPYHLDKGFTNKFGIENNAWLLLKIYEFVIKGLQHDFPNVTFLFDFERIAGMGYYQDLCFRIDSSNKKGNSIQIADGGFTDWNQKLLQNKKEQLLTSGFGTELFLKLFK